MFESNLILTCLIVSLLFEGTFFLSLALIYQSSEKKHLRIFNTFIFETTPGFKEKNSFINYFFIFAVMVNALPFIFYASKNINAYTVTMMVLSILALFCLGGLPFISLNKLREHFYLDLGAIVALLALFGIEAFFSYHMYSTYLNKYALASMIIAICCAALLLVPVFNPKLFELRNVKNEDGTYSRKSFILLAFTEWMLYPLAVLSLLPILLIAVA